MTGLDFLSSLGDAALIIAGANTISAIVRALTTPDERVEALQQARERLDGALKWAEQQRPVAVEQRVAATAKPAPRPAAKATPKPAAKPKAAAKPTAKLKAKAKPTPETHTNYYRVCMRCGEQKFLTAFRQSAKTCSACEKRIEDRPATLAEAEAEVTA